MSPSLKNMPVSVPPTCARISTCETAENWPRKLRRVSRFRISGLLTTTRGMETAAALGGFARACGEYLNHAAISAIIVTPVPIHSPTGKGRFEIAGFFSACSSVSSSSLKTMYFYSLISVHVICAIRGPKENSTLVVPSLADQISKGCLCERFFKTVLRLRKQVRKTGLQAVADGHLGSTPLGMYPERRRRTAR